jgi:hypothetical protein
VDEGFRVKDVLKEWKDQKTFCFYENATLRVRMDPLNSTMQIYFMQALGHSSEANAIYTLMVKSMTKLQAYAWPFRSFFWAWSKLRVVIKSQGFENLIYTYKRTPGLVCRVFLKLAEHSHALGTIPEIVTYVLSFFLNIVCKYHDRSVSIISFVLLTCLYLFI